MQITHTNTHTCILISITLLRQSCIEKLARLRRQWSTLVPIAMTINYYISSQTYFIALAQCHVHTWSGGGVLGVVGCLFQRPESQPPPSDPFMAISSSSGLNSSILWMSCTTSGFLRSLAWMYPSTRFFTRLLISKNKSLNKCDHESQDLFCGEQTS